MSGLVGEYECKLDAKGRFLFPAGLRRQLEPAANDTFMINRGFEQCLTLYPMNEWNKISARLQKLNLFKAENRKFYRFFHNGANALTLDGAGRLLLPKPLMAYAGISNDLVAFAYANRIELWDKAAYQSMMQDGGDDFADLAEQVMGDIDMGDDE
jgi:MraZ protein